MILNVAVKWIRKTYGEMHMAATFGKQPPQSLVNPVIM